MVFSAPLACALHHSLAMSSSEPERTSIATDDAPSASVPDAASTGAALAAIVAPWSQLGGAPGATSGEAAPCLELLAAGAALVAGGHPANAEGALDQARERQAKAWSSQKGPHPSPTPESALAPRPCRKLVTSLLPPPARPAPPPPSALPWLCAGPPAPVQRPY